MMAWRDKTRQAIKPQMEGGAHDRFRTSPAAQSFALHMILLLVITNPCFYCAAAWGPSTGFCARIVQYMRSLKAPIPHRIASHIQEHVSCHCMLSSCFGIKWRLPVAEAAPPGMRKQRAIERDTSVTSRPIHS